MSITTREPVAIAGAQDPRWKQAGWRGLGLRLSDFEVVTA